MNQQKDLHELEKLFWQLSRKMSYQWRNIYDQKFPGSQSHLLFLLQRNGPKKMSELADELNLTAGAITTASDHLIDHGYIVRTRDEKDRRVVYLKITEKGNDSLNELQLEGRKIMKLVFNDISQPNLELMNDIFKQATLNLDNLRKELDE